MKKVPINGLKKNKKNNGRLGAPGGKTSLQEERMVDPKEEKKKNTSGLRPCLVSAARNKRLWCYLLNINTSLLH